MLANPHLIKQLDRPLFRRSLGPLLHLHRRQGDVVEDREMGEQVELLKHHADAAANVPHRPLGVGSIQTDAQHIKLAAIQGFKAVEGADQRALAGPRGAHHHQHLTTGHLETHRIEGPRTRSIALHQLGGTNGDGHRSVRRGSSRSSNWRASRAMAVHASQ